MDSDPGGWVAGLGAAVGVILYAGAEIARRIIGAAPKDNPALKQIQAEQKALAKTLSAVVAQLDNLTRDHHTVEERVDKIERNGKHGR